LLCAESTVGASVEVTGVGVVADALDLGEGVLTDGFTANFDHTNLPFEFFLQTIGFSPSQLLEFNLEHADPVFAA
jgi:hypothetical protein